MLKSSGGGGNLWLNFIFSASKADTFFSNFSKINKILSNFEEQGLASDTVGLVEADDFLGGGLVVTSIGLTVEEEGDTWRIFPLMMPPGAKNLNYYK